MMRNKWFKKVRVGSCIWLLYFVCEYFMTRKRIKGVGYIRVIEVKKLLVFNDFKKHIDINIETKLITKSHTTTTTKKVCGRVP